jgi:hypothetical protein
MDAKIRGNIITILMVLGALGKTYYLYGDIPRVLPWEIVYPGIIIMNALAIFGILKLKNREYIGYLVGALLGVFYIITMLLNVIDVFRGLHQDLPYFLYGPLALIFVSCSLLMVLYNDIDDKRKKGAIDA